MEHSKLKLILPNWGLKGCLKSVVFMYHPKKREGVNLASQRKASYNLGSATEEAFSHVSTSCGCACRDAGMETRSPLKFLRFTQVLHVSSNMFSTHDAPKEYLI